MGLMLSLAVWLTAWSTWAVLRRRSTTPTSQPEMSQSRYAPVFPLNGKFPAPIRLSRPMSAAPATLKILRKIILK